MHPLFDPLVNSGMAFGAHRWLAVLRRQCERLASLMARNISDLGGATLFFLLILISYKFVIESSSYTEQIIQKLSVNSELVWYEQIHDFNFWVNAHIKL